MVPRAHVRVCLRALVPLSRQSKALQRRLRGQDQRAAAGRRGAAAGAPSPSRSPDSPGIKPAALSLARIVESYAQVRGAQGEERVGGRGRVGTGTDGFEATAADAADACLGKGSEEARAFDDLLAAIDSLQEAGSASSPAQQSSSGDAPIDAAAHSRHAQDGLQGEGEGKAGRQRRGSGPPGKGVRWDDETLEFFF